MSKARCGQKNQMKYKKQNIPYKNPVIWKICGKGVWVTPSCVPGSVLRNHSSWGLGNVCGAGNQTQVGFMQVKHHTVITVLFSDHATFFFIMCVCVCARTRECAHVVLGVEFRVSHIQGNTAVVLSYISCHQVRHAVPGTEHTKQALQPPETYPSNLNVTRNTSSPFLKWVTEALQSIT